MVNGRARLTLSLARGVRYLSCSRHFLKTCCVFHVGRSLSTRTPAPYVSACFAQSIVNRIIPFQIRRPVDEICVRRDSSPYYVFGIFFRRQTYCGAASPGHTNRYRNAAEPLPANMYTHTGAVAAAVPPFPPVIYVRTFLYFINVVGLFFFFVIVIIYSSPTREAPVSVVYTLVQRETIYLRCDQKGVCVLGGFSFYDSSFENKTKKT